LTVLGGDVAALRMATLIQSTLPGAPCIYYGDEIGLTGGNDPGCRGAFPWDDSRWDRDLRAFVRSVLRLRADRPELRHGSTTAVGVAGPALAFERRLDGDRLVVAVDPGPDPVTLAITLPDGGDGRLATIPLDGVTAGIIDVPLVDGHARLTIPARSAQVLRVMHGPSG
jgi:glycosidase